MTESISVAKVGIADMKMVKSPDTIRTSGLGSCVGVVIYDLANKVAGLAHVMLPESSLARTGDLNTAKYADTAVKELVNLLIQAGARKTSLKAKLAGGAQMFQFTTGSDLMRIGPRNVEAVKQQLKALSIPVLAEDVGGNSGRTIEFNPASGILQIRTVNKGTQEI
ncbi:MULTISPECIES: chemotaxis protein CheD [unclassified Bacillus (in: firmicutes)]|uniref:chemotaxis protein CheD n=1 Tax=unclassified Bacillus (in: firmicutes) TaxID=185979 RepID=UPI0008E5A98B|nr:MULTISPECIES: chemotaxis protein CheD [unclassified Bacillus (in: firmicutes)]SFA73742.1 chemotaxis protein CheD [Bacillus sp. UNCCL13]SFQ63958.1 chemotaxis protein CheD [Bacillus sp. cl95]